MDTSEKAWRPKGWENRPYEVGKDNMAYHNAFEAGADAMLDALFKMAKESPTGTFVIDSKGINIFKGRVL